MSGTAITFSIIVVMVVLFVSNAVPVAIAALGATLALFAAGILTLREAVAGFGDPVVPFIASLLVVSAALDAAGVTAWAGQALIDWSGRSHTRLLVLTMLLVALLTAFIGVSGSVAALLPVVVLVGVRQGFSPSCLLIPLVFAAHAGSTLVLTGSLTNLIASDTATEMGLGAFSYFDFTLIGIPLVAGTILIVLLLGWLVPLRTSRMIPDDLSKHPSTLAAQYNLFDDLFGLELAPNSSWTGTHRNKVELEGYGGLSLVAVYTADDVGSRRTVLAPGDTLVVRGEETAVRQFAEDGHLVVREKHTTDDIRDWLFNSTMGFAEVVIPPRSGLIGQSMFPGMITPSGDLIVLAIQRGGETMRHGETPLAAGDTLLLRGSWQALEEHLQDPDVLVIDKPELVRRQAAPMGVGAWRTIAIVTALVLLLATGVLPAAVAAMLAAGAVVLFRVLTMDQAYRAINWTAVIMVASLLALETAMYKTGAAALIADGLVTLVGNASPYALLAGLFALTALLSQLISSVATALIIIPIAVSAAYEIGVSPRTALVTVVIGAAASFLTPIASAPNMMVQGPGGYHFGDYWKLGLPLMAWFFLVATFLVPVFWPF